MSSSISWLHLSELHRGLLDQDWIWPSVRDLFFDDLRRLHDKAGPWDLVLFAGDLTQKGATGEFDRLTETLGQLFRHLEDLGSKPFLVAVPGNHDLVWPSPTRAVVKAMRDWHQDPDLRKQLLLGVTLRRPSVSRSIGAPLRV